MIMSCNTVNILSGIRNAKVTTQPEYVLEGSGAFMLVPEVGASAFVFKNSTDISVYKDGNLHLSLYVNDTSYLTNKVTLELTSSGKNDVDEFTFIMDASSLSNGWNHIWIPIGSASVVGNADLSKINFLRIFTTKPKSGLTMVLDDVYATMESESDEFTETSVADGKMIASCNTVNIFKTLKNAKVTTKTVSLLRARALSNLHQRQVHCLKEFLRLRLIFPLIPTGIYTILSILISRSFAVIL